MTPRRTALLAGLLLAVGTALTVFRREVDPFAAALGGTWFRFLRTGCLQIGALAGAFAAVQLLLATGSRERERRFTRGAGRGLAHLALAIVPSFVAGEILLRIVWRDGISFSDEGGPIGRRFTRDVVTNRYEGPGRGPEVSGPKRAGVRRLLVVGDSITWGQGVRSEDSLYTSILARRLARHVPPMEVASVARMGRELDDHRLMLRQYGEEIDPDVIVYQWFPNDMEIGRRNRPWREGLWTRGFWHGPLRERSFVYFFLHYQATQFLNRNEETFSEYFDRMFTGDTPEWNRFAEEFRAFAAEATALAPRVIVALYPLYDSGGFHLAAVHEKMKNLGREAGVEVLDLNDGPGLRDRRIERIAASRFDAHPNAATHAEIAERLGAALEAAPDTPRMETGFGIEPNGEALARFAQRD